MADLTFWWTRCAVSTMTENTKMVPALTKFQSSLFYPHAQPLGFDTINSPYFLSLLSPNTMALVLLDLKPIPANQPNLFPVPAWAESPCLPRGEILALEFLEVLRKLFHRIQHSAWYNKYLNWTSSLPEQKEGIITVSYLLGLLILWFTTWDRSQLPLFP